VRGTGRADNMGAISNFWAMPGSVANDWSKLGDRARRVWVY
jgi:hypothetical protein